MSCCKPEETGAQAEATARGGFASPLEAFHSGTREKILYLPAVLNRGWEGASAPDYLATVDVDPESPNYSQIIHRLQMPIVGDELHHMGWNACSSCRDKPGVRTHNYLVLGAVLSGNVYFVDVKTDPKAPRIFKTIQGAEIAEKTGLGLPHTSHCAPDEIIMSFMGSSKKKGFVGAENGYLAIDPATLAVKGRWEAPNSAGQAFGYDFWYQPRHNVMVSTEWGEPTAFAGGFKPEHVAAGKYGQHLYIWDLAQRTIIDKLDLGVGAIPLEVRFLHDPDATEGYVGCALSSTMVRFFKKEDGSWGKQDAIVIPPHQVEGWALPHMPGLITDFVISLDDKFLYLSNWLHGDVRSYSLADRAHPKLVSQVYIGGSLRAGKGVTVVGDKDFVPPEPLIVKGVEIQGGAQMIQLSLDGRRLYVTTSLFSVWDKQFYPELTQKGGQLLQLDVNPQTGNLSLNTGFVVDFGSEPWGPALAHEMRLPGGDCTSDIWV